MLNRRDFVKTAAIAPLIPAFGLPKLDTGLPKLDTIHDTVPSWPEGDMKTLYNLQRDVCSKTLPGDITLESAQKFFAKIWDAIYPKVSITGMLMRVDFYSVDWMSPVFGKMGEWQFWPKMVRYGTAWTHGHKNFEDYINPYINKYKPVIAVYHINIWLHCSTYYSTVFKNNLSDGLLSIQESKYGEHYTGYPLGFGESEVIMKRHGYPASNYIGVPGIGTKLETNGDQTC